MESRGPLFLLTTHRSGGTLLSRVFNAHPDIVVWGEHGGLLNKLAEGLEIFDRHRGMSLPLRQRGIQGFLERKAVSTQFSPWKSRVEPQSFLEYSRALTDLWFSSGLREGQSWGVKEIRYHTVLTARFLKELYPNAKFVVLRRDLVDQCTSNIMADWSLRQIRMMGGGKTLKDVSQIVSDCAYALCAIDAGLVAISETFEDCTKVVAYADLRIGDAELIHDLYVFAELEANQRQVEAGKNMVSVRSGETPATNFHGLLTRELIQKLAPEKIQEAQEAISARGINSSRLRSRSGIGRYSFLTGDHEMRATHHSTLF